MVVRYTDEGAFGIFSVGTSLYGDFPCGMLQGGVPGYGCVYTHQVKDVGSDGSVWVDVLWNEPKSGVLNCAQKRELSGSI